HSRRWPQVRPIRQVLVARERLAQFWTAKKMIRFPRMLDDERMLIDDDAFANQFAQSIERRFGKRKFRVHVFVGRLRLRRIAPPKPNAAIEVSQVPSFVSVVFPWETNNTPPASPCNRG